MVRQHDWPSGRRFAPGTVSLAHGLMRCSCRRAGRQAGDRTASSPTPGRSAAAQTAVVRRHRHHRARPSAVARTRPRPARRERPKSSSPASASRFEAALNVKRNSVAAVDAIVAEDIAKFPDQNLAESLQRIPGISIQRDAGEGRAITVRGLGAQFTRVRVNGLETVATSTDGASANRDRAFDFNVFASELFSSHRRPQDRRSLARRRLARRGRRPQHRQPAGRQGRASPASLSAIGVVQRPVEERRPARRRAAVSWKNDAGTFGAAVSAAYSKTEHARARQQHRPLGAGALRLGQRHAVLLHQRDQRDRRRRTPAASTAPSAACDQAALAFHPRIPRYGEIEHDRERLGMTGIDPVRADRRDQDLGRRRSIRASRKTREEKWGEVLLRSNERSIDVVNPVYDGNNNMISATLNDA